MHGGHVTGLKMFYLILLLPLLPRPAYQVCLPQYDYMVSILPLYLKIYHNTHRFTTIPNVFLHHSSQCLLFLTT